MSTSLEIVWGVAQKGVKVDGKLQSGQKQRQRQLAPPLPFGSPCKNAKQVEPKAKGMLRANLLTQGTLTDPFASLPFPSVPRLTPSQNPSRT